MILLLYFSTRLLLKITFIHLLPHQVGPNFMFEPPGIPAADQEKGFITGNKPHAAIRMQADAVFYFYLRYLLGSRPFLRMAQDPFF